MAPSLLTLLGMLIEFEKKETTQELIDCCNRLLAVLPGKVFLSKDKGYTETTSSYYSTHQARLRPHCVVRPSNTQDVSTAMKVLASENRRTGNKCEFAIRSGGHTNITQGSSRANGIVLDLGGLKDLKVSDDRQVVNFGTGNRWREVYSKLDAVDLAVPGGRADDVGVGGLLTGGGLSFLTPRTGLACDSVLDFEVVLASGKVVHANATENQDLWRALRGGSGNFGVVTSFAMQAIKHTQMWGGMVTYTLDHIHKMLPVWYDFARNPDYDINASSIFSIGYNESLGLSGIGMYLDYTQPVKNPLVFKDFTVITYLSSTMRMTTLTDIAIEVNKPSPRGFYHQDNMTTFKLSLPTLRRAWELLEPTIPQVKLINGAVHSMSFHALPPAAHEASRRQGGNCLGLGNEKETLVICLVTSSWTNAADCKLMGEFGRNVITELEAYTKELGVWHPFKYLNYCAADQEPIASYGVDEVRKLWEVSRKYDPIGMFQEAAPGGFRLPKVEN